MSDSPPPPSPVSSRHAISVLIVTVAILWNLTALVHADRVPPSWPSLASQLTFALAFGQVGLVAGYVVWGRLNVALRCLALLGAVFIGSRLASADGTGPSSAWLSTHLVTAIMSVAALSVYRCAGLSLEYPDLVPSPRKRLQFSLLGLVSAMTSVALIAAVVRWATFPFAATTQNFWPICRILASESAITSLSIVAPLALRTWWMGSGIAVGGSFLGPSGFSVGSSGSPMSQTGVQGGPPVRVPLL